LPYVLAEAHRHVLPLSRARIAQRFVSNATDSARNCGPIEGRRPARLPADYGRKASWRHLVERMPMWSAFGMRVASYALKVRELVIAPFVAGRAVQDTRSAS
jgi:hypothetical protein